MHRVRRRHNGARQVPAAVLTPSASAPLTARAAFTSWQADPVGLALVVLIGAGYLALVARAARGGQGWPRWRSGLAVGAAVVTAYLTCGMVGVYARTLLWMFTVQVVLLLVVVPALIAFSRPLALARLAAPGRPARAIEGFLTSRAGRVLASPATGPVVIPVVLALVFFTGILPVVLVHAWAARALLTGLLAVGLFVALPFGGDDTDATSLAIAAGIFLGFIELLVDAVPGIVVRLSTHPLAASAVARRHAGWAPNVLQDQQYAGGVLWFLGEVLDLPFLGLLVLRWIRADSAEAARVDAELDAGPARSPASTTASGLWWEQDPDRLGARRAQAIRRDRTIEDTGRP